MLHLHTRTAMKNVEQQGIVLELWHALIWDLRVITQSSALGRGQEKLLRSFDFKGFRSAPWVEFSALEGYDFKAFYQAQSLFKRVRLKHDAFTNQDLESRAFAKFIATQDQNLTGDSSLSSPTRAILLQARDFASKILGAYDIEEHSRRCRWGTKAAVAVNRINGVALENRFAKLSGSPFHCRWFRGELKKDLSLRRAVCEANRVPLGQYHKIKMEITETSNLQFVPKSYKAFRLIAPDSTIGGFYTAGLGRMIKARLKRCGLDLSVLQKTHQKLACEASVKRHLATADLSSASDLISAEHLRHILPEDWFHAVMQGRNLRYRYKEDNGTEEGLVHEGKLTSVMLMGNGHTFELQTLTFYCVLRALQKAFAVPGTISVYGDDLIYPRGLHKHVVSFFNDVHWVLNEDKTFATGRFRESCGGDYISGLNVRPFMPEVDINKPGATAALLYTLLNTLLLRWDPRDVPRAVRCLLKHLVVQTGSIVIVPPTYSSSSGLLQDVLWEHWNLIDDDWLPYIVPIEGKFQCWMPKVDRVELQLESVSLYEWLRDRQTTDENQEFPLRPRVSYDVRKMPPGLRRAYLLQNVPPEASGPQYRYTWVQGGKRHVKVFDTSYIDAQFLRVVADPECRIHAYRRRVVGSSVDKPPFLLETRSARYEFTGCHTLDAALWHSRKS